MQYWNLLNVRFLSHCRNYPNVVSSLSNITCLSRYRGFRDMNSYLKVSTCLYICSRHYVQDTNFLFYFLSYIVVSQMSILVVLHIIPINSSHYRNLCEPYIDWHVWTLCNLFYFRLFETPQSRLAGSWRYSEWVMRFLLKSPNCWYFNIRMCVYYFI